MYKAGNKNNISQQNHGCICEKLTVFYKTGQHSNIIKNINDFPIPHAEQTAAIINLNIMKGDIITIKLLGITLMRNTIKLYLWT